MLKRGPISYLNVLNVESGNQECLWSEPVLFEAPNWSRDGRELIVNQNGRLKRFNIADRSMSLIDTDFATRNNNDHGISPDGRQLVISHHSDDHDKASIIYTLPYAGGRPKQITAKGPSYWHGWSPDGNTLAYVAGRPEHLSFKIYSIDVNGGEEKQLTDGPGLDDGPEYSPDGLTIYFNSYRSGRMQIWRMNADGTNPQQLIHSQHSDWFAHPSPDGTKLVFIRYLKDQVEAHPFGQDVQLILFDLQNNSEKALTDVFYGGQGSLNVPCWSPDSTHLAYVSYTEVD